ncbi:MAG: hypothetical protein QM723_10105 [Myxococcaceae bacterium]
MSDLSARAQLLIESSRKEATPSAEELQHLRARLSANLAQQTPDSMAVPFWLKKLVGALAVAAVGVGGWYLRADHPRVVFVAAAPSAPAAAPAPVIAAPLPAPSCPPAPACEPAKAPATKTVACAPAAPAALDPDRDASSRRGMEHSLFSVDAAKKQPGLELELLMLARVALDDDRPLDALGHALQHEKLYPHSAFEEERLAIEVLAWCSVENPDSAQPQLERLLTLAPETTYLPRIRGACGEALVKTAEVNR